MSWHPGDIVSDAFNSDQVERSWPEDFAHENGNYTCACCVCGNQFFGHKRRVVCRLCAEDAPQSEPREES